MKITNLSKTYANKNISRSLKMKIIKEFNLNQLKPDELTKYLIEKWSQLENTPNLFKYKLKLNKQKILKGNLSILAQVRKFK